MSGRMFLFVGRQTFSQELYKAYKFKIVKIENKVMGAAAKVSLATVYQKHSSLRTRKRMYRG